MDVPHSLVVIIVDVVMLMHFFFRLEDSHGGQVFAVYDRSRCERCGLRMCEKCKSVVLKMKIWRLSELGEGRRVVEKKLQECGSDFLRTAFQLELTVIAVIVYIFIDTRLGACVRHGKSVSRLVAVFASI